MAYAGELFGVGLKLEENANKEILIDKIKKGSSADATRCVVVVVSLVWWFLL